MEFTFKGLKHVLRGTTPNISKVITGSSLNKLILQEQQLALLHLREVNDTILPQQPLTPDAICYHIEASDPQLDKNGSLKQLLDSYTDVFGFYIE